MHTKRPHPRHRKLVDRKSARAQRAWSPNAVQIAINNARRLHQADVAMQGEVLENALHQFIAGHDCLLHWRSLADAANVTETLCSMRICSGPEAEHVVDAAKLALAAVADRHSGGGSWTLHAHELDALRWLLSLHSHQLRECSFGEFDRALIATQQRLAQYRAGNAPAGARIIEGEIS